MNELNVFNNMWLPWKYPNNWIRNARMFFRQFKWAYQRVTRGYSDPDWYDADVYISRLFTQILRKLADEGMGYPGTEEFPTPESWKDYLYKIIYYFNYSLQDNLPNEYEDAWLKTWEDKPIEEQFNGKHTPEEQEIINKFLDKELDNDKKKIEARKKAWAMLDPIFERLWD